MKEAIPASWRGVTGPDARSGKLGLSFETATGVLRLELDRHSAEQLTEALALHLLPADERQKRLLDPASGYAAYLAARNSHSDKSSGNPSIDVSTPLEGE